MKPISPCPRPMYRALIAATAVSAGVLLAACGGGGGGGSSPPAPAPTPAVSEADATGDASNAAQAGNTGTASLDAIFDATQALAVTVAATPSAAARTNAQGVRRPQDGITTVTDVSVTCAGGGTATVTIGGGTLTTERNGVFDAGETYTITYAQCAGQLGLATLNGEVELDITSVTGGQNSIEPTTVVAAISMPMGAVSMTLPQGTITANGSATLSRTSITAGTTTTTTSTIANGSLAVTTAFNARSGSYTISNLAATRVVTATTGQPTTSTYSGTHTLSGTANGRTFQLTATTAGALAFDANGLPTSGDWTVVRTDATIHSVLADGTVVMTVDDGNDGTIDNTYTFDVGTLDAAAG